MLLRLFKTTHKLSLPSGCKASQFADDMVQFKSKTGSCNKHRTMTGQRQRRWEGNVSQHSACAQNHGRYAGIRLETQKHCESNCRPNSCENHGDETQETPAGALCTHSEVPARAPDAGPVHALRDACRGAGRCSCAQPSWGVCVQSTDQRGRHRAAGVTDPDMAWASTIVRQLHQRPCPVTPDPSRFSLLHVFTKRKPELTGAIGWVLLYFAKTFRDQRSQQSRKILRCPFLPGLVRFPAHPSIFKGLSSVF